MIVLKSKGFAQKVVSKVIFKNCLQITQKKLKDKKNRTSTEVNRNTLRGVLPLARGYFVHLLFVLNIFRYAELLIGQLYNKTFPSLAQYQNGKQYYI